MEPTAVFLQPSKLCVSTNGLRFSALASADSGGWAYVVQMCIARVHWHGYDKRGVSYCCCLCCVRFESSFLTGWEFVFIRWQHDSCRSRKTSRRSPALRMCHRLYGLRQRELGYCLRVSSKSYRKSESFQHNFTQCTRQAFPTYET